MEDLDRAVADAERRFEKIHRDSAESDLYRIFKDRWTAYRAVVNQMLVLSRTNRRAEAVAIYGGTSRAAYNAASDTLGQLTDRAVANAKVASDRLATAYRNAFWLIVLAIVIAGILVVAALIRTNRYISAPLRDLADRMRRLATNDTSVDIPADGRLREIGDMAQATMVFRNNAIELMRSQRILAEQAAVLERQLAQEQRLVQMQRNFVSMASHEFRTPLTVIDGHARRLDKTKEIVQPEEIGDRAGKVRSAVLRMTHLIDKLLNSSRLIDGGAASYVHQAEMDLVSLLQEVCQTHREMVPAAEITEGFATTPIRMMGDPKLLFQVFSNLLSNAIKYSPDGGRIEVSAQIMDHAAVVSVADNGIGIPRDDFDRLFERYHRGSNVSGIVGTGMGLYLVKMMVDLHHGAIEVESKEGKGSRFTIRLPVGSVHAKSNVYGAAAASPEDKRASAEPVREPEAREQGVDEPSLH
jgi:signal transduction histidine kinase